MAWRGFECQGTIFLVTISIVTLILYQQRMQMKVPSQQHRPRVALHRDQPLLNFTNFHYTFSADACHPDEEVKALILVTSHAGNEQGRMAWRNGMPTKILDDLKVRRIFLLGIAKKDHQGYEYASQKQVLEEIIENMDIVQGNFIEDYHNLSYKSIMGFKWAVQFCPQAQMLIKVDDDTAINLPRILQIAAPLLKTGGLVGAIKYDGTPQRKRTDKWLVTQEQWRLDIYPPYLMGFIYMTTPAVASILISAIGTEFFWIDDILFTGIAVLRTRVPLVEFRQHITLKVKDVVCCLSGGKCEFLAALLTGKWELLEQYLQLTFSKTFDLKGRGQCDFNFMKTLRKINLMKNK